MKMEHHIQEKINRDLPAGSDYNLQDINFLKEMIPHHKMALSMAKKVLNSGSNKEVKTLAENIIKGQSEEIDFMGGFLSKRGY